MNENHNKITGANAKPTLSVPSLWTENRTIKIAIEMPTTASARIIKQA
jgi:hypothetical protein